MPLTPFQEQLAKILSGNRSSGSYLAGAAALHLDPSSLRTSNDLDYFHDDSAGVSRAFDGDLKVLRDAGYGCEVTLSQPGFVRALVSKDADATKVEWAHDSAWRFMPTVKDPSVGYRLHPVDLAINKVLALVGRDEPRDFLDVLYVHSTFLSLGSMCWAAAGKDPGYSPELLVELAARKGHYHPEDFSALELSATPDVKALKSIWLSAVAGARSLVAKLPQADAGCLYIDPRSGKFAEPEGDLARLLRHRGQLGGVLPSVGSAPFISSDPDARKLLEEAFARRPANA